MIAAQLLSMANDTPAVTTSPNNVYSVPASVYEAGSTKLAEGTHITIPSRPQSEESDETKARITAILEHYKQELANTPRQQPNPRNRKKQKVESSTGNSPAVSEGSIAGCPSPSPSTGPASDSSVGLSGNSSGVAGERFTNQTLLSQATAGAGEAIIAEEKIKTENIKIETGTEVVATVGPQLLQNVMVSNVKVEGSSVASGTATLPQGLAGLQVYQRIQHGGKFIIRTRQLLSKIKAAGQSGPPPNVTMNDLMESPFASFD